MAKQRSDAERQVADLLLTAKESLHLSVAFLTRMDGTTQHLEVVESSVPFLFKEGVTQRQDTTLCQAIIDKKLPAVIPDLKNFPVRDDAAGGADPPHPQLCLRARGAQRRHDVRHVLRGGTDLRQGADQARPGR